MSNNKWVFLYKSVNNFNRIVSFPDQSFSLICLKTFSNSTQSLAHLLLVQWACSGGGKFLHVFQLWCWNRKKIEEVDLHKGICGDQLSHLRVPY